MKKQQQRIDAERERQAVAAVDAFNSRYPRGQVVEYQSHPEAPAKVTRTRSAAFVLSGHTACIMLDKIPGAVSLAACTAVAAGLTAELFGETDPRHVRREDFEKGLRRLREDLRGAIEELARAEVCLFNAKLADFLVRYGRVVDRLDAIAGDARTLRATGKLPPPKSGEQHG